MSAPRLTRRAFRAWLQSKDPQAKVGTRGWADCCPVAVFIVSQGYTRVRVANPLQYSLPGWSEHRTMPLPNWAGKFTRQIDREQPLDAITAVEALAVLDWDAP